MAYGLISYVTAYLKHHFPAEFYASLMSLESHKSSTESNLTSYINDCYKKKIKILPPDINESGFDFTAINGKRIRFGLNSINGAGGKALENILANQPYKSFAHFYKKTDHRVVNKTVVEALIKAGAFDSFNKDRKRLLYDYHNFRKNGTDQLALFSTYNETYTKDDTIKMELETIGMSVTYPSLWDRTLDGKSITIEGEITKVTEITDKNEKLMCFATVQTKINKIKCVVFNGVYLPNNDLFQEGFRMKIDGKKEGDSLLVDNVELLDGDLYNKTA